MSGRDISARIDGFTPLFDCVVHDLDVICAAVFGRMWRYAQGRDGACTASMERIADDLGIQRTTVYRHIKRLVADGYLCDMTPDAKGIPHRYADTGKAALVARVVAENNTHLLQKTTGGVAENNTKRVRDNKETKSAATATHAHPVVIPANELTNADIAIHEMDTPKRLDPLTHAYDRALAQQTPEKIIQQWRGAAAAKDMCVAFAKVFAADVHKGDSKKWLAGGARLVELGATQAELVAARDVAAKIDAVLTHPGAAYEWVKGVRARAKTTRPIDQPARRVVAVDVEANYED